VEEPKEKTTDPRDPAVITFEEDINFFDVKWELTITRLKELTKGFRLKHQVKEGTAIFSQATDVFNKYKTALESKK
jgi:hypothetical protein